MKKFFLISFFIPHLILANETNTLKIKLLSLGSDRYNVFIKGNISSDEAALKEIFQRKVNDLCGTRFEIESIELDNIGQNKYKEPTIQGIFKCYVKSRM